ncbi:MAG: hypothetical protein PHV37_09170 [Candidatus Gastranaerophilales bacterium]|nr:hypothetical protein [Candidatus Gastranaerophilales bacterium]
MQYKIDDIAVEIKKPTGISKDNASIAAAFIYKIAEIEMRNIGKRFVLQK